jgi:hypothetical protein
MNSDELILGTAVAYSDFTVRKVKQTFGITTIEGGSFFPEIEPIVPGAMLVEFLEETLPLAVALQSEKAKSELLISPILVEVRKILKREVSFFSGQEFTVDAAIGLSGICDFLMSRSREQFEVEAPVVVLVEAKKADLNVGMGQCMAEMIAAQRFNLEAGQAPMPIYGCISSGMLWRFLKLEGQEITIDLEDYALKPIDRLLGILVWMASGAS